MAKQTPRRAERSAGAFLSIDVMPVPVPMSTLADEYHDFPTEPDEDSSRVPDPEPPGLVRRVMGALSRRLQSR
jgi:hypothetical protein